MTFQKYEYDIFHNRTKKNVSTEKHGTCITMNHSLILYIYVIIWMLTGLLIWLGRSNQADTLFFKLEDGGTGECDEYDSSFCLTDLEALFGFSKLLFLLDLGVGVSACSQKIDRLDLVCKISME